MDREEDKLESAMQGSRIVSLNALANSPAGETRGDVAPIYIPPKERFLEFRRKPSGSRAAILGVIGALCFFGAWELGHYFTADSAKKFLPSIGEVVVAAHTLFFDRNFLHDVYVSCWRIFVSFMAAAAVGVPVGILMGSFANVRALLNPTLTAWRYLPAASFIPLLLVWFGPTDQAKIALLFIGVIFFLISLILDNTCAVQKELVEAGLTMGASRFEILKGIVVPAALPAVFDSMRNMIAVSWTYLVIAEIVGAQDGIGAVMMRAGRFLNVDIIMAGILTIGALGLMTDLMFRAISALLFPWNVERRS